MARHARPRRGPPGVAPVGVVRVPVVYAQKDRETVLPAPAAGGAPRETRRRTVEGLAKGPGVVPLGRAAPAAANALPGAKAVQTVPRAGVVDASATGAPHLLLLAVARGAAPPLAGGGAPKVPRAARLLGVATVTAAGAPASARAVGAAPPAAGVREIRHLVSVRHVVAVTRRGPGAAGGASGAGRARPTAPDQTGRVAAARLVPRAMRAKGGDEVAVAAVGAATGARPACVANVAAAVRGAHADARVGAVAVGVVVSVRRGAPPAARVGVVAGPAAARAPGAVRLLANMRRRAAA